MNRQQRRQMAKKKLTAKDIKQVEFESQYRSMKILTQRLSAAFLLILHDKFGFGHKRCTRLLNELYELMDSVDKGYLTLNDLKYTVNKELDIEIR